jgi:type II secretory pathway pseudopilin PulG
MRHPFCFLLLASLGACTHPGSPEARYRAAVAHKLRGDASGYFDGLLEVAHAAPTSRAGRRARATLRGGDLFTDAALLGAAAAFLSPALATYQAQSRQAEAQQGLRTIALAQSAYFAENGHYCPSFAACGLTPPRSSRYFYFLGPDEVAGGGDSQATVEMEERAREELRQLKLTPQSGGHDFLAVAVGNADDDDSLDVWTIDAANHLVHLQDDLNS